MEPRLPRPSFIKLCAVMLPCSRAFGRRLDCWLDDCPPTPPFTPIEFPPIVFRFLIPG